MYQTFFYKLGMADNFDMDDLLDDVLNESVSKQEDDILDSLMDEMMASRQPIQPVQPLKYSQLESVPGDIQREWEQTISSDEQVMKNRTRKALSNAYSMSSGTVKERSMEEFLSTLCRTCLRNRANSETLINSLLNDEKLQILFREEVIRKIRAKVNKKDRDLLCGNFPHLKKILDM